MSRLTRGGQVTLPQAIREALGLKEGSLMRFQRQGNQVTITPVELVPINEPGSKKKGKSRR